MNEFKKDNNTSAATVEAKRDGSYQRTFGRRTTNRESNYSRGSSKRTYSPEYHKDSPLKSNFSQRSQDPWNKSEQGEDRRHFASRQAYHSRPPFHMSDKTRRDSSPYYTDRRTAIEESDTGHRDFPQSSKQRDFHSQARPFPANVYKYHRNTPDNYSPRDESDVERAGSYHQINRSNYYDRKDNGLSSHRSRTFNPRSRDYDPNRKYSQKKRLEYKEENFDPDAPIRLNKFLANSGVCSRRDADKYIEAGVVSVNGKIVTELGSKVKRTDEIKFHDESIRMEKKVYVLLNKPKDCLTTMDDPQGRKTVLDLVKNACRERIYPVGRLDRNTTGVLLLTNDGELSTKLTHPKFLKKKIYHVHLDRDISVEDMQQIRSGITLADGTVQADAIDYADDSDKKQVGIEIHSGRNRIVRRIFESLNYQVVKLDRVYFAGLTKKKLRRGEWRYLSEREVNSLKMGAFE